MRPSDEIFIEWVDDEAVVLDPRTGELHYLNTSGALALALIQEHGYEPALIELEKRAGGDKEVMEQLHQLLDQMVEKGLLVRD